MGRLRRPGAFMIIDDEPEVHEVTRLVLGDFRFENRGLDFLHAYSAAEARDQLSKSFRRGRGAARCGHGVRAGRA